MVIAVKPVRATFRFDSSAAPEEDFRTHIIGERERGRERNGEIQTDRARERRVSMAAEWGV